ncbi:MAG: hypothetical protein WBA93_32475 [Microcoleaceae cyanobacterium]
MIEIKIENIHNPRFEKMNLQLDICYQFLVNPTKEIMIYTGPSSPLDNPFYQTATSPLEAVKRFREQVWADIEYFQKYEMVTPLLLKIAEISEILDTGKYGDNEVKQLTLLTHAKQPETDHAQVIGKAAIWLIPKSEKIITSRNEKLKSQKADF